MGWVEETFKAGQNPFGWLSSAERLQAAAETILSVKKRVRPRISAHLGLRGVRRLRNPILQKIKRAWRRCAANSKLFAGAIALRIRV